MPKTFDFVQEPVTLDTSSWTPVLATDEAIEFEIRQLPSQTSPAQQILRVKHVSAADDDYEEIPIGGTLRKGARRGSNNLNRSIQVGDVLGYFQCTTGAATLQIKGFTA